MLKVDEFRTHLKAATGYEVVYNASDKPITPPFIAILTPYTNNFFADDRVFERIDHLQIELYTTKKDPAAEDKVEKALASFCWEKSENYISDEKVYQIIYEIEV